MNFVIAAGTGTAVGIATMYGVPVVAGAILKVVGFGTGGKSLKQNYFFITKLACFSLKGVAGSSVAARMQSSKIAPGSFFSICQSTGAAGIGSLTAFCIGAVAGAATTISMLNRSM